VTASVKPRKGLNTAKRAKYRGGLVLAFPSPFYLAAYLAAFMLVAMDINVKAARLGRIVLRVRQLRAARERPLVLASLFEGDDRIARFAGGRFMDMRTCRLDVAKHDLAFDAFIILDRNGAVSGCGSLDRRDFLVTAQLNSDFPRRRHA
jgi:hypothetical protein